MTLTRTTDPIRLTRRGPDPNRPTNGSKQGRYRRYDLSGKVWSDTAGKQYETAEHNLIEFYALVNLKLTTDKHVRSTRLLHELLLF